jgi:DNA-binding NarL/FixJ family response regulator
VAEVSDPDRAIQRREVVVDVVGGDALDARIVARELERDGLVADVEVTTPGRARERGRARPDLLVVRRIERAADLPILLRAAPTARILVVLDDVTPAAARRMLESGADGVIPGADWASTLAPVARAVLAGMVCLPAEAREVVGPPPALSVRERQVLALMAAGLSNAEIADRLVLSESTVKSHVVSAFRRLGVHSRREAVAVVLGSSEALRRSVLMTHQPEGAPRRVG